LGHDVDAELRRVEKKKLAGSTYIYYSKERQASLASGFFKDYWIFFWRATKLRVDFYDILNIIIGPAE